MAWVYVVPGNLGFSVLRSARASNKPSRNESLKLSCEGGNSSSSHPACSSTVSRDSPAPNPASSSAALMRLAGASGSRSSATPPRRLRHPARKC